MPRLTAGELSTIKLVSFDVWKTLIQVRPGYKLLRFELLTQALGLPAERVDEVGAVVTRVDSQLNDHTDRTGHQHGTAARLEQIADHFGVVPSPDWIRSTTARLREHFATNPPLLMEPNMPQSLERVLTTGRQVALISNTGFTSGEHVEAGLRALGIMEHISYQLYSDQLGVAKPSSRIFQCLAERSQVSPGHILHIGDNRAADYDGARAYGLQAAWLTGADPADAVTVPSIAALVDLLEVVPVIG